MPTFQELPLGIRIFDFQFIVVWLQVAAMKYEQDMTLSCNFFLVSYNTKNRLPRTLSKQSRYEVILNQKGI